MDIKLVSKKFITNKILPLFSGEWTNRSTKVPIWRVIKAIVYRLKTGCQWRNLPMRIFCRKTVVSWQTVYYHFRKWSKMGIWKEVWQNLLSKNKQLLDLSSIQLDGSQTLAKKGGESVKYQHRKRAKTTNALFLTDKKGQILAMSPPISGHHNDLFSIEKMTGKMFDFLQQAGLNLEGLFLNADAGFDSEKFRRCCEAKGIIPNIDFNKRNRKIIDSHPLKDDLLYKDRFVVEQFNAWLDAFRALFIRFETLNDTWSTLHYIAFSIFFYRTI